MITERLLDERLDQDIAKAYALVTTEYHDSRSDYQQSVEQDNH